jgi:tRNA threonylcarbamoyladenosine biosynthesis protein TsaB
MITGNVLVVETSTEAGSVAIVSDGSLAAELSFSSRDPATGVRSEAFAPAVASCLASGAVHARDISAIVCGAGPGGFTSLRSAAAFSKGMCSALGIPLYAVSSLELLAWSADTPDEHFIVALQAGRNEWFGADVTRGADKSVVMGREYLVSDDVLRTGAARTHARLVGPGLEVNVNPAASALLPRLADIEARGAVDLDSWEPAYGRLAEAQVKWETAHGRRLSV